MADIVSESRGPVPTKEDSAEVPGLVSLVGSTYHLLGANPLYHGSALISPEAREGETDIGPNYVLHANIGVPRNPRDAPSQEDRVVRAVFRTKEGRTATRFAVIDGMGGHGGGDVAAQLAADALRKPQSYADAEKETIAGLEGKVKQGCNLGEAGACTAVAIIVGNTLYRNRRGDARIYVFSKDGTLKSLTRDENVYYAAHPGADPKSTELDSMKERKSTSNYEGWSRTNSDVLNDLSIVCKDYPEDRLDPIELESGDVVFLCSDGVSDNATAPEIWNMLSCGFPHVLNQDVRSKMKNEYQNSGLPQNHGGSKGISGKPDNLAYAMYVHGKAPSWWPKPQTKGIAGRIKHLLGGIL